MLRSRQIRALAQQPMRGEPRARQQRRRPPREAEQDDCRGEAADHADEPAGDEVHRVRQRRSRHAEIEVARDGQVADECRVFEVAHALGRTHASVSRS